MFFEVRRVVLHAGAEVGDGTGDRFHVLNVVEGDGVLAEPDGGTAYVLAYAETLVGPAAVGSYRLRAVGDQRRDRCGARPVILVPSWAGRT